MVRVSPGVTGMSACTVAPLPPAPPVPPAAECSPLPPPAPETVTRICVTPAGMSNDWFAPVYVNGGGSGGTLPAGGASTASPAAAATASTETLNGRNAGSSGPQVRLTDASKWTVWAVVLADGVPGRRHG